MCSFVFSQVPAHTMNDGSKEEIENVVCPDCGGKISYRYSHSPRGFEVRCVGCGYLSRATGGDKPKCVDYFGAQYDWKQSSDDR